MWSQDTTPPETITDFQAEHFYYEEFGPGDDVNYIDLNWTIPFDDSEITNYKIYNYDQLFYEFSCDGCYSGFLSYTDFNNNSDYCFKITAVDEFGNESELSNEVCFDTNIYQYQTELFISQYYEGPGNNNALEISVSPFFLDQSIDLSDYDLRINLNGGNSWSSPLNLSGSLIQDENYNNSYVIINSNATELILTNNSTLSTNNQVLQFDGNDAIGLFKNGVLVDSFGDFNNGGAYFGQNVNMIRDECSSFQGTSNSSIYNASFWVEYTNTCQPWEDEGIGKYAYCCLLSVNEDEEVTLLIEPNPVTQGYLNIHNANQLLINNVSIYNINGQLVYNNTQEFQNNHRLSLPNLSKGVYFLKLNSNHQSITKKIIVN